MEYLYVVLWIITVFLSTAYAMDCFGIYRVPVLRNIPYGRTVLSAPEQSASEGEEVLNIASGGNNIFLKIMIPVVVLAAVCGVFTWRFQESVWTLVIVWITFIGVSGAATVDLMTHLIPNRYPVLIIAGRLVIFAFQLFFIGRETAGYFLSSLLGFAFALILLLLVAKLSKNGLGMGDVKLFSAIGFSLGLYGVFFTLFFALLCSAVTGLVMLLARRGTLKKLLPFGPFILAGLCLTIVIGLF